MLIGFTGSKTYSPMQTFPGPVPLAFVPFGLELT